VNGDAARDEGRATCKGKVLVILSLFDMELLTGGWSNAHKIGFKCSQRLSSTSSPRCYTKGGRRKMQEARKKKTALLIACQKGDALAVHGLLAAGVDLEAQDQVSVTTH
jgi:hypothetical protein